MSATAPYRAPVDEPITREEELARLTIQRVVTKTETVHWGGAPAEGIVLRDLLKTALFLPVVVWFAASRVPAHLRGTTDGWIAAGFLEFAGIALFALATLAFFASRRLGKTYGITKYRLIAVGPGAQIHSYWLDRVESERVVSRPDGIGSIWIIEKSPGGSTSTKKAPARKEVLAIECTPRAQYAASLIASAREASSAEEFQREIEALRTAAETTRVTS